MDKLTQELANKAIAYACARGIESGLDGIVVMGFRRDANAPAIFYSAVGSAVNDAIVNLHGIERQIAVARERLREPEGKIEFIPAPAGGTTQSRKIHPVPAAKMEFVPATKTLRDGDLEDVVRAAKKEFGD